MQYFFPPAVLVICYTLDHSLSINSMDHFTSVNMLVNFWNNNPWNN